MHTCKYKSRIIGMMLSNCFCEERVVDDQSCWWLRRRWRKWPEDPALMATSPSEMASSIRRVFPQVSTEWVGGRWGETAPLKPVWHDQASYLTHRSTGHTPPLRRVWPAWVFMFRGVCLCLMPAVPPEIKVILTGRRNGRWLMEGVLGFDLYREHTSWVPWWGGTGRHDETRCGYDGSDMILENWHICVQRANRSLVMK